MKTNKVRTEWLVGEEDYREEWVMTRWHLSRGGGTSQVKMGQKAERSTQRTSAEGGGKALKGYQW